MTQFKPLAAAIGAMMILGTSASAYAISTNVMYSTTGAGSGTSSLGYDVLGINEFDWQSSGDLTIQSAIIVNGAATTLSAYFGTPGAATGDVVTFDIHAQARLNDMLLSGGGSIAPATLDANGSVGGNAGFEITTVLDAKETAIVTVTFGVPTLTFFSLTGTTTWYHDALSNSDVNSGVGFNQGVAILTGTLGLTPGKLSTFAAGTGGSTFLSTSITSYNTAYLQADPAGNAPLIGASFDTLVKTIGGLQAAASSIGDTVGQSYVVAAGDQSFKADANSQFESVPEPGTLFLLGAGLLGLGGLARRKAA